MFCLEDVSISYENQLALQNIYLKIDKGEKLALIGPSGAGKTTLLRKLYEISQVKTALIHQQFALVPQLTCFHNVYTGRLNENHTLYNLLNLIKPQKKELKQILPILTSLELDQKLYTRAGELSGGQQQRVAIARAIFRKADLLLADEPFSSIDPHQAVKILNLLMSSYETTVLSIHSVELALKYLPRIVAVKEGRILFDLPSKLVTDKLLNQLYAHETD